MPEPTPMYPDMRSLGNLGDNSVRQPELAERSDDDDDPVSDALDEQEEREKYIRENNWCTVEGCGVIASNAPDRIYIGDESPLIIWLCVHHSFMYVRFTERLLKLANHAVEQPNTSSWADA